MSEKKAAQENPLIPNARLKQMYRAVLHAHLLGQALPPAQRALTAGREAVLVSTSLDLSARDVVVDALVGPVIDSVRGAAMRLTAPEDGAARLWSAAGAAAAIRDASRRAQCKAAANDLPAVVVHASADEVDADVWRGALAHCGRLDLPIVFVVLPPVSSRKRAIDLRAVAYRSRVPAMPVDADDPVAVYRVAQESISHARIGGGPALIECIRFRTNVRRSTENAALSHLAEYILSRGIASRAWMEREAAACAAKVRALKSASK